MVDSSLENLFNTTLDKEAYVVLQERNLACQYAISIYKCKDYGTFVALLSIIINGFYYLSLTLSLMNIANCREQNEYHIKENSANTFIGLLK